MRELTFLTEKQCFGDSKLDIFKKRGAGASITDYSVLLGGRVNKEGKGMYWTQDTWLYGGDIAIITIEPSGIVNCSNRPFRRDIGARPSLKFSSIDEIPTNGNKPIRAKDGILEVEYGYYPQKIVSPEMSEKLDSALSNRIILPTRNIYTSDFWVCEVSYKKFYPFENIEYEFEEKKYVRVPANLSGEECILSDGLVHKFGELNWIEITPIKWLIDEKEKIMVTEKIIFSGVQYNGRKDYDKYEYEGFEFSDINIFIDKYFSREIEQIKEVVLLGDIIEKHEEESLQRQGRRKTRLEKLNPDKTELSNRTTMTDTELIHNWIEAGESVLLRGPSGIGKTERIKSLYPDLIYIKLTNNMFPEKVVGSVNLQTGQSIPPDFAKTTIMQEATEEERKLIEENIQNIYDIADTVYERSKESDKKIVIMLDELLNVKPAVQSLVYTLVLNRFVEIGQGLKLPANVVVVATGNQKKYSSVAEDLAEPLEKRFDHILDMEPKVGEWLTEYAIPNKIHPSVIGYILSKYNEAGKSEDIGKMGYFYEEPEVGEEHKDKNECNGRTNDPRGWTSISNTLYHFEKDLQDGKYEGKNVENALQRTLSSKLREEWAAEFFDFYNMPTLTPEEVVAGIGEGYTQDDLPMNINERFCYMTALITADETQVEACRKFIREYCDPEYLAIYDIYWAGKDERRMEKIADLQEMDLMFHSGDETKDFAEDGALAFSNIGQMYRGYLSKEIDGVGKTQGDARG